MACCNQPFGKCEACQNQAILYWNENANKFLCSGCDLKHAMAAEAFKADISHFLIGIAGIAIMLFGAIALAMHIVSK